MRGAAAATRERRFSMRRETFGSVNGATVERFTLSNGEITARILTYGGILQSLEAPDRCGRTANITLGFDNLDDYVSRNPYFGAVIGRYANRIARGTFTLDGTAYRLPINNPPNTLHGGERGFHTQVWKARPLAPTRTSVGVLLAHTSPDGTEGFPAELSVRVGYCLTAGGELRIDYRARNESSSKATVVNLTNHAYWNLHGEGAESIVRHVLEIPAAYYTPIDGEHIPTGEIVPVAGTPFDFRAATPLGQRITDEHEQLELAGGYDHNFVLDRRADPGELQLAARLSEPITGRVLEVSTTEPGLQLYSGNLLDGTLIGPGGQPHEYRHGVALETQHFPDSPNHPHFPTTRLAPGAEFRSTTVYSLKTNGPDRVSRGP